MNPRNFLNFLFILGFSSIGMAQVDSLYAVKESSLGGSTTQLIRVSTATAQSVPHSPQYGILPMVQIKPMMNPHNDSYNIVGLDLGPDSLANAGELFLFSINVNTGTMQSVEIDSLTVAIDFDCEANAFYYLSLDYNLEIVRMHKYDVQMGIHTLVNTLSFFPIFNNGGMPQQYPFIDIVNKTMVVHGFPSLVTSARHIYTVDLQTGTVLNDFTLVDPNAAHQMVYNLHDSSVYALEVNFSPNERSLVQVDQQTWSTTSISTSVADLWYINQHAAFISSEGGHYYFMGYDDAGGFGYRINSFDLQTGMISSSPAIGNEYDVRYLCDFPGECDFSTSIEELAIPACGLDVQVRNSQNGLSIRSNEALRSVELFNLRGELLRTWQFTTRSSTDLFLNEFSSGMYLLVIKSDDCQVSKKVLR